MNNQILVIIILMNNKREENDSFGSFGPLWISTQYPTTSRAKVKAKPQINYLRSDGPLMYQTCLINTQTGFLRSEYWTRKEN